MTTQHPEKAIKQISERLLSEGLDPLATYLALRDLNSGLKHHFCCGCPETVAALNKGLDATYPAARRLQYFTYREAARAMAFIIVNTRDKSLSGALLCKLKNMVNRSTGCQRRGVAEVLGSLPVGIDGPEITDNHSMAIPTVKWNVLLTEHRLGPGYDWETAGRSIIFSMDQNRVLVIKLALAEDTIQLMNTEARWMRFLDSQSNRFTKRFDIPEPLKTQGTYLFCLEDLPQIFCEQIGLHSCRNYGFAYKTHKDYFAYPNDHRKNRQLAPDAFCEVMF